MLDNVRGRRGQWKIKVKYVVRTRSRGSHYLAPEMGRVIRKYGIIQGMLQKLDDKRSEDARVSMEMEK